MDTSTLHRRRRYPVGRSRLPLLVTVVLLLVACAGSTDAADKDSADEDSGDATSIEAPADDEATGGGLDAPAPTTTTDDSAASESGGSSIAGDDVAAPEIEGDAGAVPPPDPTLAAGRVDDGARWEEYLLYREEAGRRGIPLAPIDVDARRVVTVLDVDDRPLRGAVVEVLDAAGEAVAEVRTHADGRAVVFADPEATSGDEQQQGATTRYRVRSEAGDLVAEVAPGVLDPVIRTPGSRPATPPDLDLHLVVDATGSMGDEIERLKANLASVVEGIGGLPGAPQVRLGMTVYRDQGDEFVTRTVPFTTDVTAFLGELRAVTADGGGDNPEAVEPALAAALDDVEWSEDPGTVRLAFLVADAAPHLADVGGGCGASEDGGTATSGDEGGSDPATPGGPCVAALGEDDGPYYLDTATRFAEAGIKVVPVASSNLDPVGESVFRELALVTQAPFLFLTYGADGASPGEQRPDLSVDDFAVLSLDEMIAQVVAEEMTAAG